MRGLFLALFAVAIATAAAAQVAPNAVLEHYRAYRAALDAGDAATAESEAELALTASEARDSDGGRTAVLAFNLATARLLAGDAAGALAPAQRALALAQASDVGLNPVVAELVVGRAELVATTSGDAGARRIQAALSNVDAAALPAEEVYPAAIELGAWALGEGEFETALMAYGVAEARADGSPYGRDYGLGRALMGQGIAIFLDELDGRGRIEQQGALRADGLLREAESYLSTLSQRSVVSQLTAAQLASAEAVTWQRLLRARMEIDGIPFPETGPEDGNAELGRLDLTQPRCHIGLNRTPHPRLPNDSLFHGNVAAVAHGLHINEQGEIVQRELVIRIGSSALAEAVERVSSQWTITRLDTSPPNCRMEMYIVIPTTFAVTVHTSQSH